MEAMLVVEYRTAQYPESALSCVKMRAKYSEDYKKGLFEFEV